MQVNSNKGNIYQYDPGNPRVDNLKETKGFLHAKEVIEKVNAVRDAFRRADQTKPDDLSPEKGVVILKKSV